MWLRNRREKRKQQEIQAQQALHRQQLLEKLAKAESGMLAADEFDSLSGYDESLLSKKQRTRWKRVLNELYAERAFPKNVERLKPYAEEYAAKRGTIGELTVLVNFIHYYKQVQYPQLFPRLAVELGFTVAQLEQILAEAVELHYQRLMTNREEPESFRQLRELIHRTEQGKKIYGGLYDNDLKSAGIRQLPYPDNWNELVATHYDTPHSSSFIGLPERGPGDVRLLAAEAIRTSNFVDAQIALSYCNSLKGYREAVGDVLTAELAKVVTSHRAETRQEAQLKESED